ncbi:MAG TPA: hypothetical protein P5511_04100, partial [Candidatus Goldiibacteriota bacterium]|nr:hypothetical protein [Candidatus Goldiibacteriota bacterium]
RMLEEAVMNLKGGTVEEEVETKIKTAFKAYIPDSYIWDSAEKLKIYRRIFLVRQKEEIDEIRESLRDVWGALPEEVINILTVARLKLAGKRLKAGEISFFGSGLSVKWETEHAGGREKLKKLLDKKGVRYKAPDKALVIEFAGGKEADMVMELLTAES